MRTTIDRAGRALLAAAALGLCLTALPSARAESTALFDFENDAQGWQSRQVESTVARTADAANVKVGQGALEWTYNASLDTAQLGVMDVTVKAGATGLSFWTRSSTGTNLQLLVFERDGSIYGLMMRLAANRWQHYETRLTDLTLAPNSADENGQLDPEQVGFFYFMDSSRFSGADAAPRKLWLDAVDFTKEAPSQRRYTDGVAAKPEVLVDDFGEEALAWEASSGAELSLIKADDRTVLSAVYDQGQGSTREFVLDDHLDARYGLAKAFRVIGRATRKTQLRFRLREWNGDYSGPEYEGTLEIPAGKEWSAVTLPLAAFKLVEGSKDSNGKLDLDTVWLLEVRDVTPGDAPVKNELELDRIGAVLE